MHHFFTLCYLYQTLYISQNVEPFAPSTKLLSFYMLILIFKSRLLLLRSFTRLVRGSILGQFELKGVIVLVRKLPLCRRLR